MQLWEKAMNNIFCDSYVLPYKFFFLIGCHLQMLHFLTNQPHVTITCWGCWNTVHGRQKPVCRALGKKSEQRTHTENKTRCGLAWWLLTKAIPDTATKKLFLCPIPYAAVHISHFLNHSRGNLKHYIKPTRMPSEKPSLQAADVLVSHAGTYAIISRIICNVRDI